MKFKRVLAGLLVGAMVVTSAPVSGLGALAVLAEDTEDIYEALTGFTGTADSQELTGEGAGNGIVEAGVDGNLSTFWHSNWGTETADNPKVTYETDEEGNPVRLTGNNNYYLTLQKKSTVSAVTYTPRNHYDNSGNVANGAVVECNVYVSTDNGETWTKAAEISGDNAWSYVTRNEEGADQNFAERTITFAEPCTDVTNIRFEAIKTAGVESNKFINAAEFGVIGKENGDAPVVDTREALAAPTLSVTAPVENTAPADTVVAGYAEEVFADASAAPAALTTENLAIEADGDYQAFSGKITAASSDEANKKFNVTGKTPFLIRFMMKTDVPTGVVSLAGKMDEQFGVQIDSGNITLFCHDGATNGWPQIQKSLTEDFWGQWHEVVAMYNGDSLKLYVDGVQGSDGERGNSGVTLGEYANTQFTLGYNSTKSESESPAYKGKYADVVMYTGDEVPTDAEDYAALIAALAEKTPMFDLDVQAGEGEAPNYTMTTAWTDANGAAVETFEKDRLYTMTATLTANENYKFTEESKPAAVKVGEDDVEVTAEISEDGSTMTVSCVFGNEPGTVAKEALAAAKAAAEKVLAADRYTEDSYAVFAAAKEAADNLAEDASAEEMQKAADDLMAAINGLIPLFTEISAPSVSYTAPEAGDYAAPAAVAMGETDAHYDAVADRTENPASLAERSGVTPSLTYDSGNWGFVGQWAAANDGENNGKFDIYGPTPMALRFKVKVPENDGNVQIMGKMDNQYGIQIEGSSNRVILYCCDANGGWPEVVYDFDDSFWDVWHDVLVVYTGQNMQIYVDGEAGHASEGRVNADESYDVVFGPSPASVFTIGYNKTKADGGNESTFPPMTEGLLADIQLYSGTDYSDGLTKDYEAIRNQLDAATPEANITLKPYDVKTTWAAGDEVLAGDAKFASETVYTATTVFTAYEGYGFTENSKPSVDGATVEIADGGMTMTVTKTFPATAVITCTCELGEITGVADQTVALGTADSKTVTLKPSAAVTGDCKIDGHPQNVTYTYEVIGAGTTGATVTDAGVVTVTDAGNATVKITATLTKDGGEVLTAEKSIVLTVTSNKATAAEKSDLKTVIDDAKTVNGELYTEATFTALSNAIKTAESVYNKANASKTEVANAQKALEDAQKNLKTKEQEMKEQIAKAKEDLNVLVADIQKLDQSLYTAESMKVLIDLCRNEADKVYNDENATLEDVNEVIVKLNDAKAGLVLQETAALEQVKADIAKALASADAVLAAGKKDNTDAQWNAFVNAYNAVKNADADADSATLRSLLNTLTTAQGALKADVVLAAPTIKTAKAGVYKSGVGVKVTVNPVAGASRYDVYRVVKNKAVKVGTTEAGKTTIIDKKVTSKTVSYYAVAVSADGKVVSKAGAAKKVTLAKAPTAKKATRTSKGVKITWKKVKGAKKYVIYRSTKSSSGYTKIGTAKKSATSFVSKKKVTKGKTYYYKVVAVKKSTVSLMSKAKKVKIKK